MDEIVLFRLIGDDLVQRSILVEQQIRVAVAQHTRAFGREHKELISTVGHIEGPDAIVASFQRVSRCRHLLLAGLVDLAGEVFVAFGAQLVCRVIADGRERLDDSGLAARARGCALRRGMRGGRLAGMLRRLGLRSLYRQWRRHLQVLLGRRQRAVGASDLRGSASSASFGIVYAMEPLAAVSALRG